MIEFVTAAIAIAAALAAAIFMGVRSRRQASRLRVERAFQWVISSHRPPDASPEERRAAFRLIQGGGAAALASLLGARALAVLRQAREHPAITSAAVTAVIATGLIILATLYSRPGTHAGPTTPHTATLRASRSPRNSQAPTPRSATTRPHTAPAPTQTATAPTTPPAPAPTEVPADDDHAPTAPGSRTTEPAPPRSPGTPPPPPAGQPCLLDVGLGSVRVLAVCAR